MSQISLEEVRQRWVDDRPIYEKLSHEVEAKLYQTLTAKGIMASVSGRAKGVSSLLKKFVRKGYSTYEDATDKAGVRVVVNLHHELQQVDSAICELFDVRNKEDKEASLGENKMGYLSVHYDVSPNPDDIILGEFSGRLCEIQVRSLCQDVWAEMAHTMLYKPSTPPPLEIRRRINGLSAVLEMCDREFLSIHRELQSIPGSEPRLILAGMEEHFFKYVGRPFDAELSLQVIEHLLPFLRPAEEFLAAFGAWCTTHDTKLQRIYEMYKGDADRWVFLFQPECFVLFNLLEQDRYKLADLWVERFPFDQLHGLSLAWGFPIET